MKTIEMGTKGANQRAKLLAAFAVIAMVVCALCAIMPTADAEDVTPIEVGDLDEFNAALDDKAASILLTSDLKITESIVIGYDVTIDLGGNTITDTREGNANDANGRVFTIEGDANVTIRNGSLENSTGIKAGNSVVCIDASEVYGGSLTITGVAIDSYAYGVAVFGNTAGKNETNATVVVTVNISDSTINSLTGSSAISTNGKYGGESISISDSVLTSAQGAAIYAPSNGSWTVENTTIEGVSGIDQRAGDMSVTGGSITYNGPATDKTDGDGPAAFGVGASVLIDSAYSNAGASLVIDSSVKMIPGANAKATLGDVVVSPFDYDTSGVTADSLLTTEKDVAAPVVVSYSGIEMAYDAGDNATASAVKVSDNGTFVTAGKQSDVAFTQDVSNVNLTQKDGANVFVESSISVTVKTYAGSVSNSMVLGTGSSVTLPASATGIRFIGASDSKATIGDEAQTIVTNANNVTDFPSLKLYLEAGVDEITLGADIEITENVEVKSGTVLNVPENITIAKGVTFTNNGTIDSTSGRIILSANDSEFVNNGKITKAFIAKTDTGFDDYVTLTNIVGNFTVGQGSIAIDGTISGDADVDGGVITVNGGKVEISGAINGDVRIEKYNSTAASFEVVFGKLTVNNGATLTLGNGITYTVDKIGTESGRFLLYGTLNTVPSGTDNYGNNTYVANNLDVKDGSEFRAYSGSTISYVNVTGDGSIDLSQAQTPQEVGQDINYNKTYGQLENVTIVNTLNIKTGVTVIVLGGFQVNEGVTLTIESGATLIIDSKVASMIVDGSIVIEDGAKMIVRDAQDISVSGTIDSTGTLEISEAVTVTEGGVINAYEGSAITVTGGLTIDAGAALNVYGTMTINDIVNNGTVTLDGAVLGGESAIALSAQGAVVDIISVTGNGTFKLSVTDAGMKFPNYSDKNTSAVVTDANTLSFTVGNLTGVSGVKVTETISGNSSKGYNNEMYIEGTVAYEDNSEDPADITDVKVTITVDGPHLYVTGDLVITDGIELNVTGNMTVSGTVTAIDEHSEVTNAVTDEGQALTVTGTIQVLKGNELATANLNAVHYETKKTTTEDAYHYYTNFADAVASGASEIDVYGKITVDADITIPAGMKVQVDSGAVLTIGADNNRDITMTVTDGASVTGGTVDVKATLYFENKKDAKANPINSDVMIDGEKDRTYTNVYTALANADAGETVTVTADRVVLKSNLTIPEGVTLDVPNSKVLAIIDGVTLTVNGILRTAETVEAVNAKDTAASEFGTKAVNSDRTQEYAACIIVNGTFMSMSAVEHTYYQIPGAYYELVSSLGDYYYVTPVEAAATVAADVEGDVINIYGAVNAGDVAFNGANADEVVTINVNAGADVTISSVALTNATLNVLADGRFTGTVKVGDAAADAVDIRLATFTSANGLCVSKADVNWDDPKDEDLDPNATLTVSAGTVTIGTIDGDMTVATGATLGSLKSGDSTVDGFLTVNGTVTVDNERTLEVTEGTIVNGTITVAAATDDKDAGALETPAMLIGLNEEFATVSTTASVTGNVTTSNIFAVSGVTIDTAITKNMDSTAFNVEGSVWITAYSDGQYPVPVVTAVPKAAVPVKDARFDGWVDEDGKAFTGNVGDKPVIYADIEYDIYVINLRADQNAVSSITIDGNIMQFGMIYDWTSDTPGMYYGFTATVSAGSHTIQYQLANGYSGNGVLTVNGTQQSGLTFTTEGNPEAGQQNVTYNLQLTGFEKSGYVPDSPDTPSTPTDSGDDGMTITDYLLIVLVVLIIVMAIIVAMRLMRS